MKRIAMMTTLLGVMGTAGLSFADGYAATVSRANALIADAAKVEGFLDKTCKFGDFNSRQGYARISAVSGSVAQIFPGSNISCMSGAGANGTLVRGAETYAVSNGKTIKMTIKTDSGFDNEISFGYQKTLAKVSDGRNFITLEINHTSPNQSRYIDANLPVIAETQSSILAEKGISLRNNELISLLNEYYALMSTYPGNEEYAMSDCAAKLVMDPAMREDFIAFVASKSKARIAKSSAPKPSVPKNKKKTKASAAELREQAQKLLDKAKEMEE